VFALCSGRPNLNRLLLCHGVTDSAISHVMGLDYLNEKLQTGLVLRIEERDYKAAGRLLQLGVTPVDYKNKSREGKHTILQLLARDDEVYLFKKFLGLGEDIHVPPAARNGATALQYAAINGNFSIANMCLEAGADVNAAPGDYEGRTAIEGAAEWGRLDMVRYLLEAGAMIQGRTNMNYRRTVYRAWENGHWALVGMIQVWKREQYGEDDCEDPEVIVQVMTKDELVYASEEARLRYLSKE
jgi:ankyrin repeat protein